MTLNYIRNWVPFIITILLSADRNPRCSVPNIAFQYPGHLCSVFFLIHVCIIWLTSSNPVSSNDLEKTLSWNDLLQANLLAKCPSYEPSSQVPGHQTTFIFFCPNMRSVTVIRLSILKGHDAIKVPCAHSVVQPFKTKNVSMLVKSHVLIFLWLRLDREWHWAKKPLSTR